MKRQKKCLDTRYLVGAIGWNFKLLGIDIGGDSEFDEKRRTIAEINAEEDGYTKVHHTSSIMAHREMKSARA